MRLRCLSLAFFFLPLAIAWADQADDIAQIHLEVIGGRKRIEALQALRMTGVVVMGNLHRVRFTMLAARPNRVRLETEADGRALIDASDGVNPPWEFDTGASPVRYRTMSAASARAFTADAEFDDPLVAGTARGFTLEYGGETEVDGKKMLRVLVTHNLSDTFGLLLDEETYFIVLRVEGRVSADGTKHQIITHYGDFRPVGGVLLPHKITLVNDGSVQQQMLIEKIETNPELKPDTFVRPGDAPPAPKESP